MSCQKKAANMCNQKSAKVYQLSQVIKKELMYFYI